MDKKSQTISERAENGINASPFSFDRCEWTINEKDILYT